MTVKIYSGSTATGNAAPDADDDVATERRVVGRRFAPLSRSEPTPRRREQIDAAGNVGRSAANTFTIVARSSVAGPADSPARATSPTAPTRASTQTANLILGLPAATPSSRSATTRTRTARPPTSPTATTRPGGSSSRARGRRSATTSTRRRTRPGYFNYFQNQLAPFGASATDPNRGYYSYDLGDVARRRPQRRVRRRTRVQRRRRRRRGSTPTSRPTRTSARWRSSPRRAGAPAPCTAATRRWPRTSRSSTTNGAELVLSGDDHLYERFAPQDPQGFYDPTRGVRQLIVGHRRRQPLQLWRDPGEQRGSQERLVRNPEASAPRGEL